MPATRRTTVNEPSSAAPYSLAGASKPHLTAMTVAALKSHPVCVMLCICKLLVVITAMPATRRTTVNEPSSAAPYSLAGALLTACTLACMLIVPLTRRLLTTATRNMMSHPKTGLLMHELTPSHNKMLHTKQMARSQHYRRDSLTS